MDGEFGWLKTVGEVVEAVEGDQSRQADLDPAPALVAVILAHAPDPRASPSPEARVTPSLLTLNLVLVPSQLTHERNPSPELQRRSRKKRAHDLHLAPVPVPSLETRAVHEA